MFQHGLSFKLAFVLVIEVVVKVDPKLNDEQCDPNNLGYPDLQAVSREAIDEIANVHADHAEAEEDGDHVVVLLLNHSVQLFQR